MESPHEKPLVTHIVRQFLPNRGGLEDVVANLAREVQQQGFRVRVVTLDRLFVSPGEKLPAREMIDGIEVVRIPWRGSSRYPLAPSIFKHIGDADILHIHAIDFFYDALAWGWLLHRKPMIVTTHGGFFHTSAHSALKSAWFQTVTRLSALAYRKIIGCSKADIRLFNRIAKGRTVLIENAAGVEKFANAAAQGALPRMITIGRFSANKQIGNLLEALAVLCRENPDWHIDICGVPSDLKEADLREHIERLGLGEKVGLHIGASNEDIRRLIGQSSLFVSASTYEGFGLVAIEAMSAGLMPVLNPNDAYRDLADAHPFIRLADFQKPLHAAAAIKEALQALAPDPEKLRSEIIDAAKGYSWEAAAGHYTALYQNILAIEHAETGKE